jgi:hypothetical protein
MCLSKHKCPWVWQIPLKAITLWQIPVIAIPMLQLLKSRSNARPQCQMTCTINTEVISQKMTGQSHSTCYALVRGNRVKNLGSHGKALPQGTLMWNIQPLVQMYIQFKRYSQG